MYSCKLFVNSIALIMSTVYAGSSLRVSSSEQ